MLLCVFCDCKLHRELANNKKKSFANSRHSICHRHHRRARPLLCMVAEWHGEVQRCANAAQQQCHVLFSLFGQQEQVRVSPSMRRSRLPQLHALPRPPCATRSAHQCRPFQNSRRSARATLPHRRDHKRQHGAAMLRLLPLLHSRPHVRTAATSTHPSFRRVRRNAGQCTLHYPVLMVRGHMPTAPCKKTRANVRKRHYSLWCNERDVRSNQHACECAEFFDCTAVALHFSCTHKINARSNRDSAISPPFSCDHAILNSARSSQLTSAA